MSAHAHVDPRVWSDFGPAERAPNAVWAIGRTCDQADCATILCRYNSGPSCWCCTDRLKRARRARREESNLRLVPDPSKSDEVLKSWLRMMEGTDA